MSLTETIQHYEEFSNSLRTELRTFKVTVDERNNEINSLKQELIFLRERGGDFGDEREPLIVKLSEIINERE